MKKMILLAAIAGFAMPLHAQNVGINATGASPNASAGLDVDFTNKGLLIPRLALTQTSLASPVTAPATSLLVYNTATVNDVMPGYYYWNGTAWVRLLNGTGSAAAWLTTGNSVAGTEFIGTTNAADFTIYTGNTEQARFLANGSFKTTGTTVTSPGIWMNSTITAAAATAYGILSRGTLTAAANNDRILPFSTNMGVAATGAFTGLSFYGGHFDASSWTKSGTGTIDNGYGIYVTAPAIATNNYAGVFTGGFVGIGTNSPISTLHVAGTGVNYVDRASNVANEGAAFIFRKSRGTIAAPAAVQSGDELGKWLAGGYDGSGFLFLGGMSAVVTGTVTAGTIPADLVFGISNAAMGNPTSNEAMRITPSRFVGIGTTTPATTLDISGNAASGSYVCRITNTTPDGEMLGCMNYLGTEGASIRQDNNGHSVIGICNNTGTRIIQLSSAVDSYINSGQKFGMNTGSPTAAMDVNGSTGYNQLRLRSSYTPTNSADANGNTGDIAWDANYIYVKTAAGWKRSALTAF